MIHMSHLSEKIAEFVFGELSASEMTEAKRHLAECSPCRAELEQFQRTHAMLKASPDVEPPRRIIFEVEKTPVLAWVWRWVAPMAASAAVALAIVMLAPAPVQPPTIMPPPTVGAVSDRPGRSESAPAAAVDYQKIETWLTAELNRRDATQTKELQRIRGELALLDSVQRSVYRDILENSSAIQLLAQKSDSQE